VSLNRYRKEGGIEELKRLEVNLCGAEWWEDTE